MIKCCFKTHGVKFYREISLIPENWASIYRTLVLRPKVGASNLIGNDSKFSGLSERLKRVTSSGCLAGAGVEGAGGAAAGGEVPCFKLFLVRYIARATARRVTRTD